MYKYSPCANIVQPKPEDFFFGALVKDGHGAEKWMRLGSLVPRVLGPLRPLGFFKVGSPLRHPMSSSRQLLIPLRSSLSSSQRDLLLCLYWGWEYKASRILHTLGLCYLVFQASFFSLHHTPTLRVLSTYGVP